jgi:hypothetical protein
MTNRTFLATTEASGTIEEFDGATFGIQFQRLG